MKTTTILCQITLSLMLFAKSAVASSPITVINFEGPAYATGSVGGQDSWVAVNYNVNNNAVITANNPISGTQSLLNDGTSSRSDVARTFPVGTFADGVTVTYKQKILVDSVTGQGSGLYIGKDPGTGHDPIWVRFLSGNIDVLMDGDDFPFENLGTYQLNKVYQISINLNFDTEQYSVTVSNVTDQVFVGALAVPMLPDVIPNPATDSIGIVLVQYDGQALFDDIDIIPPPISLAMSLNTPGEATLAWDSRSSAGYEVDRTRDLPGLWISLTNGLIATPLITNGLAVNVTSSFAEPATNSQAFYRVSQISAPTYVSTTVAGTEAADAVYTPIPVQTGTFACTFDAWTSSNSVNQVIGLATATPTAQSVYATLSCLIQFNLAGFFNVRDGTVYHNDTVFNYTADTKYSFRVVINVPANTYSVYVTPDGGAETEIASDYAFRVPATSLSYRMIVADHTSSAQSWITVGNFKIQ